MVIKELEEIYAGDTPSPRKGDRTNEVKCNFANEVKKLKTLIQSHLSKEKSVQQQLETESKASSELKGRVGSLTEQVR